ncbi:PREDICTED: uncharacterized protein LOC100636115 isoform X3 [Amphimedon queenslandica]|uniref:Ferric-chelate reductase 1 n=1 Tax=Amphimedon queenslandica TaxID=400682 RepID=A0AAN0J4J3_AMPQE|nr:PREDICTED: uncharacterized protein LOC100636115 isoform X3 [Amphimedon queenslandica]|eukprot:XP_019851666.1 PREDICTED: uncharacterized protein LOC100636115 isoform X3 [Amphimedon queenslandica]
MVAVSYCRSFSLLLVFLGLATALPSGAPPQACVSLVPGHGAVPIDPALRPPPYFIVSDLLMKNGSLVYEPDETYNISLISVLGATFRGFIVQARDVNGSVIGMMDTSGSNGQARLADCPDSNNSTVTHVNNYDKSSVSFQWTAPSGFDDIVELRYSVVIMFASYYVNLNAADFPVNCNITLTDVGTHPLIFRMPENCPRQECEYFVGLGLNPSDPTYLDVYLEGNAAGWIAIGFSNNTQMENDDVLGCRVNSGTVTVVDTWNPSPRQAPNMLDATQDGLCVQSTSFTNSRITCSLSRLINGTDIGQDYDLDNLFYLLYGRRAADQGPLTSLGYHTANGGMTPSISPIQYNPVNDNNTDGRCPVEVTGIESHNLVFGMPEGCLRADCEYYVGLSPNPSDPTYLDVYLEGNAAGWIAIGFSLNTQMENDDVLGCRVNSGAVTVVDTWNPSPRRAANMLDATQDGLCVQSTSFTNGRITCRFSRTINITDVGQDYNLNSSYHLLFGRRAADQGVTTVLGYHTENGGMTPAISEQQFNPVVDNNANERCPSQATAVGSHNLLFGMPQGCDRSSCEYYVGLSPNPSDPTYLDVYLEGNAAGWIAIGFSNNTQMENDDVLGCRVNSDNVTVVDTWNPSPRRAPNMLDATQDGLCVQSTSFTNGRITCSFSRLINGTDISQDYDLDNLFYLLYGRRAADQGLRTSLGYHSASGGMTPSISPILYNPVNDSNTDGRCPVEVTSIESHNLIFGMPEGCLRADCEYYVGLSPNPSDPTYLDVYLEGNAAGWIAIGFSNNTQMEDDDVLGCRVNSSIVTVVDTWNPSPRRTANMLDATQDGLCVQSTSFTNGRITCRFSRTINITDVGQDYNLDDSYYLLFGRRAADQGVTTVLGYHSANGGMTPAISEQQYNPVVDNNANNRCPDQATAVGSHNLLFGMPQGCERSACEYYVGLSPNPSDPTYLDVYLEGNAAGWIAVGFSLNTQMENDDVLGCRVNSGAVTVVDTWNPSSRRAPNVLDATQDGLCVQSTSFTNNRITCRFSRTINITDVGQDYNLNSSYYLLFGRRAADQGPTTALGYHTVNGGMTPAISEQQFNPVRDRNTGGCPPVPPTEDLVYTFQQGTQGSGYYFGARINRTNPLYLDMRLEASASGWVGVGFSVDNRMGVDDVLACQRDPNSNMVTAVDTWNPGPAREPNQIDPGQIDICPYTGSFENGRIICTFSRLINTGDTNNDLDLGMALFQLYGTSDSGGLSSLAQHGETPAVTAEAIVVTNATGAPTDDFPRRELTRVHGILMIVAWPLLVVSAIFFALWMKPALPNGEWFQIHRAFMIVSLFLTALGFIFIFVANAKNPGAPSPGLISFACGKSTGHFVIGIIVFFLQIMNPIIAIFRCKPTGSYRWIFNLIHGTAIGFLAEILALVNVGLGIALFESGCGGTNSFTLLWVYIVFVILLVIIQLVMTIVFTVMAFRAPPEKRAALGPTFLKYYFQRSAKSSFSPPQKDMEMTEKGKAASNDPPPKKKPSEDSPFRWGGFGVFIIITFVLVVVMAIMVAVI